MSTFSRDDDETSTLHEILGVPGLGALRVVDAVELRHEFPVLGVGGPVRKRDVEVLGLVDLADAKAWGGARKALVKRCPGVAAGRVAVAAGVRRSPEHFAAAVEAFYSRGASSPEAEAGTWASLDGAARAAALGPLLAAADRACGDDRCPAWAGAAVVEYEERWSAPGRAAETRSGVRLVGTLPACLARELARCCEQPFGGARPAFDVEVVGRAAKGCEIPNFKGSYLGRFPLVSADFWTSDHLSGRSRSVDAFVGTRARGTLTLKRR